MLKKRLLLFSCIFLCRTLLYAQSNMDGSQKLFNGKDLAGWKKLQGTAIYTVEDGVMVGTTVLNSPNTFLVTEKEYGDFILELDVMIEDTANNSGIQTRSHFGNPEKNGQSKVFGRQLEIDPSARKWTGGIYDESRRQWLYPLSLNTKAQDAFKSGQYNHFRIECIGDEMKTWVNDVAAAYVVDTIDNTGFIGLQVHSVSKPEHAGKRVYFKNINIQTNNLKPKEFSPGIYVVSTIPNYLTQYEKENGWVLLFDGKTTKAGLRQRPG